MPTFQPFRLTFALRTPVVLTDFPPTLDALLYEALSHRYVAADNAELLQLMREYLQFNEELGVFHASALRFGLTMDRGLTVGSYVRTDRHTPEKLSSEMFSPNGSKGRYKSVLLAGGPTKQRLRNLPAYRAPFAIFDGVGDPWAIRALLQFFVLGIGYDAQNCQMGAYGEIFVNPLPEDTSLTLDNIANRPLPTSAGINGIAGVSPLLPPYYSPVKQSVVAPQRVRSVMLPHIR